jgi:NSS family neurotransmitter:Na+ symporter
MLVGLFECLLVGWVMPVGRLRETLNEHTGLKLPAVFDQLIKFVIPAILLAVLGFGLLSDFGIIGDGTDGMYGSNYPIGDWSYLVKLVPLVWIVLAGGGALILSNMKGANEE